VPGTPDAADVPVTLAAWRASGAARLDPVRFSYLEALARRAQDHHGDVRQLLDARLASAVQAYAQRVLAAQTVQAAQPPAARPAHRTPLKAPPKIAPKTAPQAATRPPGPLAELARLLAPAAAGPRTAPELKSLRLFRRSWTRRKSEQQLQQSQAVLPENAGPLHSQALVLRALQLMRGLSPEYLERFMAHAETLLWLEQAQGARLPAARNVVRGSAPPAGSPAASVTPAAGTAPKAAARKSRTRQS
jgi:hypothetical protein